MRHYLVSVTTLLLICVHSAHGDVYLVYSGEWMQQLHQHSPTTIFRLVEPPPPEQPHLVPVESVAVPDVDFWHDVRVVPEQGLVLVIVNSPDGRVQSVVTIPMDDLSKQYRSSWSDPRTVTAIRSIVTEAGEPLLEVRLFAEERRSTKLINIKNPDVHIRVPSDKMAPSSSQVAGPHALYQMVRLDDSRRFIAAHPYTIVALPDDHVPDEVEIAEAPRWSVIAAEPEYTAFAAGVAAQNQAEYQVLVRRADNGTWKSYLVPGGETRLRVLGGWLVGMEQEMDPRTDPAKHFGFPGMPTGNVVLINPMTETQVVAPLGKDSEVLLFEDSRVLFRRGSRLYRATISPTGISDEQLIVDERHIAHVQQAFSARVE